MVSDRGIKTRTLYGQQTQAKDATTHCSLYFGVTKTSNETGTEVQLSECLSRGLGATLSGEMEISHCDYNLHCPKLDQLSTGVSRLSHIQCL